MKLVNSTPFVPFQFEAIDKQLNLFGVVVARGSFAIEDQRRLRLAKQQESLTLTDRYFDDSRESSLRFDSSLAPYKPNTDLLIEATAYSPSGAPEPRWISGVQVGPLHKQILVTGPRHWTRRRGAARLTESEPIDSLEVRYEHAFGGVAADGRSRFAPNPVGVGYGADLGAGDVRCPQLLRPDCECPKFGAPLTAEGLGPIAPGWAPRVLRSGTTDDAWRETRAPYLPSDFSFEFYNAAASGLTFPGFANGDEIVRLTNLSAERRLTFGLPRIQLATVLQFEDGRIIPGPMALDTIELRVEQKKAFLQWRGIYPAQFRLKTLEIRMSAPDDMLES